MLLLSDREALVDHRRHPVALAGGIGSGRRHRTGKLEAAGEHLSAHGL